MSSSSPGVCAPDTGCDACLARREIPLDTRLALRLTPPAETVESGEELDRECRRKRTPRASLRQSFTTKFTKLVPPERAGYPDSPGLGRSVAGPTFPVSIPKVWDSATFVACILPIDTLSRRPARPVRSNRRET